MEVFVDEWLGLIFVGVGLLLALLELLGGVETELDLVAVGSAFIIGGLAGWLFEWWLIAVLVTSLLCIAYVAVGRRYIKRWVQPTEAKTNVDALIGREGVVIKGIAKNNPGRIRVGNEEWLGSAEEDFDEGAEVVVTAVRGATLIVTKANGGDPK
ncbi:MAG: NfeD family protein [Dehalococcoidales bacterium]|nr:MAG: NfeD family protein [Dehalococcoidales bacterium]